MNSQIFHRIVVRIAICTGVLFLPASAVQAQPVPYKIDNAHTSVIFAINHFGLSYTYGRFNQCGGTFAMENGEPTSQGFSFVIDANSIDTNNEERDNHLRGPDFFNSTQFPEIQFKTTGFKKVDNEYQVTGDMQILDQIRTVTMPLKLVGIGNDPFGKERAGFFTKFTIKRSDFGMDAMTGSLGDNISITFSFEGVKE